MNNENIQNTELNAQPASAPAVAAPGVSFMSAPAPAQTAVQPAASAANAPSAVPAATIVLTSQKPPANGMAVTSLILGIIGIVFSVGGLVPAILSVCFAVDARRRGNRSSLCNGALVVGIIALVLSILWMVGCVSCVTCSALTSQDISSLYNY